MHVGTSQAAAWRQATDVTIGETLDACRLGGHGLPSPAQLGLTAHRSAEEHYARLSRLPTPPADKGHDAGDPDAGGPVRCGSAADGLARRHDLPLGADIPCVDVLHAAEIRRRVAIEFRGHMSRRGLDPGDAARWVEQVLEPAVAWQQVLAAAVRRAAGWAHGHADYTYTRPSRRQSSLPRVILPATRRPLPVVAIVVDTSGSMDDGLLAQALGEVDGVIAGLGVPGTQVTVLACDAAVHAVEQVRRARDASLGGGGGTDLRLGVGAAAALRPRPDVVVVLTDGFTLWPDQPPAGMAAVAAVLHRAGTAPPPTPTWCERVVVTLT
jgi:Mg-chelatase subunit ChlD